MITFQEFMLTSKHFCLIRSDIPFRLICNPNGGDWLSGTDICNLPAGSFTFDFWKLLPEKYFKNNPAFKLGLAYDADLLTDGRKVDISYSDLDYGTGVAGLAGSSESSLAEIVLIDTLISDNLLEVLQKLETGNVFLGEIAGKTYSNLSEGFLFDGLGLSFRRSDLEKITKNVWLDAYGFINLFKDDIGKDWHFYLNKVKVSVNSANNALYFTAITKCKEDDKKYVLTFTFYNGNESLSSITNLDDFIYESVNLFTYGRSQVSGLLVV